MKLKIPYKANNDQTIKNPFTNVSIFSILTGAGVFFFLQSLHAIVINIFE